jgi:OmpA-OmpF porin, OOP family
VKKKIYSFILSILAVSLAFGQKIVTLQPQVDKQSQDYVKITKVELTDDYTILHFRYTDRRNLRSNRGEEEMERILRRFPGMEGIFGGSSSAQSISMDARVRLYEPKNAAKKYRFVKVEGIPQKPDSLIVKPGQQLNFKVYFRRLDPGVEVFDMFEGKDDGRYTYWNFYGIHIKNPKQLPTEAKVVVKKDSVVIAESTQPVVTKSTKAPNIITVRGNVLDAKTQKPIAARLNYVLPNDDGGEDSLQLSASSGKFKINLGTGRKYAYVASAKGYFPSSGAFDLTKTTVGEEVSSDILLSPVAVGESITLNNIYFDVSKFDLLPASFAEMDRLSQLMAENPTLEIRVEGHTDNVGDFDENLKLSLNRANAVKKYLVAKGIESSRVEAKGFGATRPIGKGTSEAERRKNRRVEFVILKK